MQTPFDSNFFDLFGIEKSYLLDKNQLRDRFRDLQKKFHPDNFSNATDQDRRLSAQYASLINEAFTTLSDPVSRGQYILSLSGISVDEEQDTSMDPDFLMQQIDFREELDASRSSMDALKKLSVLINDEFSSRVVQLGEIFEDTSESELEIARNRVRELQFFSRLRNEIEEAEESLY